MDSKILYALFNLHCRKSFDLNNDYSLYLNRPIIFLVLHPANFSVEEAVAPKRSGLGYVGVKIIKEMHRKIKSALIFPSFCIKAKGQKLH